MKKLFADLRPGDLLCCFDKRKSQKEILKDGIFASYLIISRVKQQYPHDSYYEPASIGHMYLLLTTFPYRPKVGPQVQYAGEMLNFWWEDNSDLGQSYFTVISIDDDA